MKYLLVLFLLPALSCRQHHEQDLFNRALENGRLANEAFVRSNDYLHAWLRKRDPGTGLIPRNLNQSTDIWNAQDAAADNYPYMVLSASFTDRKVFEKEMIEMLKAEEHLTSRIGRCPATWSFGKKGFADKIADTGNVIFGSAEYMKDGLLPLTEWLGPSPWCDRMLGILDDLQMLFPVNTEIKGNYLGGVPTFEAHGDLLQVLSRMYWMTKNNSYLEWAVEIGDYYLLGDHHPTDNSTRIRLRDHGCEMVLGLCELYATLRHADSSRASCYKGPICKMLDCILEKGRNADGLFYDEINPLTGQVLDSALADTWGYILDGYYIMYQLDGIEKYREAVLKVFSNLHKYSNYSWEGDHGSDGFADAIESAINLYNRERDTSVASWIDSEIKNMWAIQKPDGIIEGWHGDGNFARTSILYALWKTQGLHLSEWRKDVVFGSVLDNGKLYITIKADSTFETKLIFDTPRHKTNLHLPFDWARINQFQEWVVIDSEQNYSIEIDGNKYKKTGKELIEGLAISVNANKENHVTLLLH